MISLYGAGGHAKVVRDVIINQNKKIAKIIDDIKVGSTFYDLPVLSSKQLTVADVIIISVGDNETRKKIATSLFLNSFSNAIRHHSATISPEVLLGQGTVIMPKVVINAETRIGNHCIVNTNVIVEHDCVVDHFVHISPGAIITGGVHIGEGSHIGAGAIVLPRVKIGKWCTIGAGAVVLSDIEDYTTVVGNPAKKIVKKYE